MSTAPDNLAAVADTTGSPAAVPRSSYRESLKAMSLIGGATAINVALGIVRNKALAVLIGPTGIGLAGAYSSITALASTASGLGVSQSGVRSIAEASAAGDQQALARTAKVLRSASLVLGVAGTIALVALSVPASLLTFGDDSATWPLVIVSCTVLFAGVAGGQTALLQGLRKIKDLASISVWSGVLGTVVSLPIVYVMGLRGVPWMLVAVGATALLVSWGYARRVALSDVHMSWREQATESRQMVQLGISFMVVALATALVSYAIRALVINKLGLAAAGLYQAAAGLSSVYVGFILTAMGRDFYPRLTGVIKDHVAANKLVNEQAELSLLVATPGVLATIAFAPWVISILYSSEFAPATEVLRWQILGVLGRVISWPLGYILVASGRSMLMAFTEVGHNLVHLSLVFAGINMFGLIGTGIAFFVLYVLYTITVVSISQNLTGFVWSRALFGLLAIACLTVTLQLVATHVSTQHAALLINTGLTLGVSALFLARLTKLVRNHA